MEVSPYLFLSNYLVMIKLFTITIFLLSFLNSELLVIYEYLTIIFLLTVIVSKQENTKYSGG